MALYEGTGRGGGGCARHRPATESMVSQEQPEKLGRYEITGFLGKGAMGVVYEGRDPNIGRRVAIKTARRDVLESSGHGDEMMERFLREARAAGALNHPNIVTVYDADEQDGTAYIAMEFIEGSDLQKSLDERRRYTPEEVAELCATICDALHHAHERGVVHRDVKPANIMLLPDGTLRVTDFGIARIADSTLTIDGAMIGTPHYMSPEQFMGHRVDGRSDLFSVAVIAYVLLTGERPFPGDALATVMHAVTQVAPIAPRELNFSVSPSLNSVVLKALSKDPNQRYKTAADMAKALREATIVQETAEHEATMIGTGAHDPEGDTLPGVGKVDDDPTLAMTPPVTAMPVPGGDATLAESPVLAGTDSMGPVVGTEVPRRPLLAAAVAVVLVVVGALVVFMQGGEASDGYSVGPDEYHYSQLAIQAFLSPSFEHFLKNDGRVADPAAAGLAPATAEVSIRYASGNERVLGVLPAGEGGTRTFQLHGRPASFTLFVRQDGYEDWSLELGNPSKPGDVAEFMAGARAGHEPILLCPITD